MDKQTLTKTEQAERRTKIRQTLDKIVVNAGVGRASQQANFEEKVLKQIMGDISMVVGQRAQVRRAKKSVAGFKIRENQVIGVRVTLRGSRMVDFFERLLTIVLPRVRDFNGIDPQVIDANGALNIGLKEQLVFPEINAEESTFLFPFGMNIVPRTRNRATAVKFYEDFGVPFMKAGKAEPRKKRRGKKKKESK